MSGGINPGSGNITNVWKKMYEGIHRANEAITNLPPKSPCSEEKKARLISEARFLRAWFYYSLNELFRGVPYYDVPVAPENATNKRETEEFIWGKVLEDLDACIAEPNFPNNDFKEGRATKGAAYSLRGMVYMQQQQWQKAAADFAKVGDCGYELFAGDYKALFTEANERCKEMIFSVQNFSLNGYGSISQKYLGTRSAHGSCWGDHQITNYAVDLYEKADGTPFKWDDSIPGYSAMEPKEREVYFLRDTLRNGTRISAAVTAAVKARLTSDALKNVADKYLPEGNEARVRTLYNGRDPRLEKNVITPYAEFRGINYTNNGDFIYTSRWPYVANSTPQTGGLVIGDFQPDYLQTLLYFQRKFVYEGYNGSTFNREYCPTDDPVIRYANVLLMWAEALVEQGDLNGAMDKVKQVRDRAGIPTLSSNFSDQTKARNYVRDERRREMLGEGIGYFDELRWGTLKQSKYGTGAMNLQVWGVPGRGASFRWPDVYSGDKFVWPVPRGEIQMNPNLTPTPGWTY